MKSGWWEGVIIGDLEERASKTGGKQRKCDIPVAMIYSAKFG